jgi:OOP family OmpA-OmpF porin
MTLSSSSILATLCDAADDPFAAQATSSQVEPGSPLPPSLAQLERIILRGAHFDVGKADIKPEFEPVLKAAARILQKNPDARLTITGHTDTIGSDEYNQRLSERRAEAVKQYLVSRGVAAERLDVVGKGRSEPLVPSTTSEGRDNPDARAINRRVELRIQQ